MFALASAQPALGTPPRSGSCTPAKGP